MEKLLPNIKDCTHQVVTFGEKWTGDKVEIVGICCNHCFTPLPHLREILEERYKTYDGRPFSIFKG